MGLFAQVTYIVAYIDQYTQLIGHLFFDSVVSKHLFIDLHLETLNLTYVFLTKNRVIALTTSEESNVLLPTKKPWLYLINNGNMSIYENKQHYYSIPNNTGSFTDKRNWFTRLKRNHQKAILIDFFDSAGQEVLPLGTDLNNIDSSDLGF